MKIKINHLLDQRSIYYKAQCFLNPCDELLKQDFIHVIELAGITIPPKDWAQAEKYTM